MLRETLPFTARTSEVVSSEMMVVFLHVMHVTAKRATNLISSTFVVCGEIKMSVGWVTFAFQFPLEDIVKKWLIVLLYRTQHGSKKLVGILMLARGGEIGRNTFKRNEVFVLSCDDSRITENWHRKYLAINPLEV